MGQDGAFDGPTNNNQLGKESPPVEISGGYQSGGGYYGKPAGDIPPPTPVAVGQNLPAGQEDLPVTECPVGWKCVAEFFCDVTATMVPQRVSLNKAQLAIRGELIQCMNQATGQFNVCCRAPRPSPQLSPQLRPEASSEVSSEASNEVPSSSSLDPTRIQFEKEESLTSCPVVRVLPPIELCANRKSTCWSAGLPDTDCIDNALCCFDGCANVCLGRGPVAGNPGPQTNPRPTAAPAPVISPQQNLQENFAERLPTNLATGPALSPQVSSPPTVVIQQAQSDSNSLASTQPFVTCPSAMKCVPRNNCDFNGVMVNTNVVLSDIQEKQRVPLIPCINAAGGNAVDVCCRDPNYKDPWPEMKKKKKTSSQKLARPSEAGQPNIAINQRVSSPGQTPPKRKTTGGYGR